MLNLVYGTQPSYTPTTKQTVMSVLHGTSIQTPKVNLAVSILEEQQGELGKLAGSRKLQAEAPSTNIN